MAGNAGGGIGNFMSAFAQGRGIGLQIKDQQARRQQMAAQEMGIGPVMQGQGMGAALPQASSYASSSPGVDTGGMAAASDGAVQPGAGVGFGLGNNLVSGDLGSSITADGGSKKKEAGPFSALAAIIADNFK